jgi:hypothetical protein
MRGQIFRISGLILLFWLGLTFSAQAAGQIEISIDDVVHVIGHEVTLGQIARISGDDPQEIEWLQNIVIGRAPLPGKAGILYEARISRVLEQAGLRAERIQLRCPARIKIVREKIRSV